MAPNPIKQEGIEYVPYEADTMLASCRQQLIEDGLLSIQGGQYFITAQGKQRVERYLDPFKKIPSQLVLIEHYIFDRHDLNVGQGRSCI